MNKTETVITWIGSIFFLGSSLSMFLFAPEIPGALIGLGCISGFLGIVGISYQIPKLVKKLVADTSLKALVTNEKKFNSQAEVGIFLTTLIAAGWFLYTSLYISNAITPRHVLTIFVIVSLPLALATTALLVRTSFTVFAHEENGPWLIVGIFITFTCISISTGDLLNRKLGSTDFDCIDLPVIRKYKDAGDPPGHYIVLDLGNGRERYQPGLKIWDEVETGEIVNACILRGFFGYDYLNDFEIKSRK